MPYFSNSLALKELAFTNWYLKTRIKIQKCYYLLSHFSLANSFKPNEPPTTKIRKGSPNLAKRDRNIELPGNAILKTIYFRMQHTIINYHSNILIYFSVTFTQSNDF